MIYNDKLIFVHVPKTGGTSLRVVLVGKHGFKQSKGHHTAFRNRGNFPTITQNDRYSFGFIRNPWERMVSYYRFMCQKGVGQNDHKIYKRDAVIAMGFKRWVLEAEFGSYIREAVGDHPIAESIHHVPQMWWLKGVDRVCRFERLQADVNEVMQHVGMQTFKLPHVQKTKGGVWRDEYDNELIDFVAEKYATDIEYGEYTFDES